MEKVLVTGGAGFIGSHVTEELLKAGYEVAVVDHLGSGQRSNIADAAIFYELDIVSTALRTIFEDFHPSVVVHLAARSNVPDSIQNPKLDAQNNILGTLQVLENCRDFHVRRIVYSSSAAVYGQVRHLPITEETPPAPLSPYGISKWTGEQYIELFCHLHGISSLILRFANVYGPRQNMATEAGVISVFIENLINGDSPIIYGDGYQTRDFVFVQDVARAVRQSVESEQSGIYHVSSGKEESVKNILEHIKALMNTSIPPIYQPEKPGDIYRSCLSNIRIKEDLNWFPSTPLEEGLAETIAYYRQTLKHI